MRTATRFLVLALVVCGFSAVASAQETATVTINNGSTWTLYHWFMSPVDQDTWGPDQLGDEVVAPGGSFLLTDIPCDLYDVKLVDEAGDECVIAGATVCDEDNVVDLTDEILLTCQAVTAEEGAVEGE